MKKIIIFMFQICSLVFLLVGCGSGGGGGNNNTQPLSDADKLAKAKLVEGYWTFSFSMSGSSYTEKLLLENVAAVSLATAPNIDYGADASNISFPNSGLFILAGYSSTEDAWAIVNTGVLACNSSYTCGYSFKTDGNKVLNGGCFYRTNNSTGIRSICYSLSGLKTSSHPPATATLTSITVTPANPSIATGSTQQFTATGMYSDGTIQNITASVTWSSSDTSKATISNTGLATAVAAGTTTIKAMMGSVPGTTILTVISSGSTLTSITVTPAYSSITYGMTQQFIATGTYANGTSAVLTNSITWTSVNVCSLDSLRAYTPIPNSSLLLGDSSPLSPADKLAEARRQFSDIYSRAKSGDSNAIAEMESISTIFLTLSKQYYASGVGFFTDYTTVKNALVDTASLGLRDPSAAAINACGLSSIRAFNNRLALSPLVGLSPESKLAEAHAQFSDISTRAELCDAEAIWQINAVSTSLLNASSAYYGGTSNASYLADFTSVQNALSAVNALVCPNAPAAIGNTSGLATGVAVGTSKITAISGGVSGSTTLTIKAASTTATLQSISVSPSGMSIAYGATQQFTATGMYSDGTTQNIAASVAWSSSDTSKATISNTGVATAVAAGTTLITATSGPVSGNATLTITTATQPSAPGTPIGVAATAGNQQVTISWNAVSDATSYNIYWSTALGVTKAIGTKIANATSPYVHLTLSNGTTYYYIITAVNSYGESDSSSPVSALPQMPTSGQPTSVSAVGGNTQSTINWTAPAEAIDFYTVYYSTTDPVTKLSPTKLTNITGTSATITGLSNGIAYYFIVTATNAGGESAASSQVSATPVAPDTTAPSTPTNLATTATSESQITLSWLASTDNVAVMGYKVYRDATFLMIVTSDTATTDVDLQPLTNYCYTVTAIDAENNESTASTQSCATTQAVVVVKVPDTGQTTKHSVAFGDDSDYIINPPSYTDNSDGTITDNVTGLIWQKQDDNVSRNWETAGTYCSSNAAGLPGVGWRLPTNFELVSILNYDSKPAINSTYFPGTNLGGYWSSTSFAGDTTNAWMVFFESAPTYYVPKKWGSFVRCVR